VVWSGTACSPCVNAYNNRVSTCSDNVCMRSITVDDVHSVVAGILDQRGGRPAQVVEIPQLAPKTAARETSPDAPAMDPDTRSAGPRVDA